MPSSRKLFTLVALIAATSLAATDSSEETKKKARTDFLKERDAKKPAASKSKTKAAEPKGETRKAEKASEAPAKSADEKPAQPKLSLPLPKGQDSKGIVIPYTDATGKKSMVFKIGVGRRLDDEHVDMNDLTIETFDEEGAKEMSIELPASKLNLSTRIIAGDQTVTIKRSDFQLTGQTMEFNTESKQGWI